MKKNGKKILSKKTTLPKKGQPPKKGRPLVKPDKPAATVKLKEKPVRKGKAPSPAAKTTSAGGAPLGHVQLWPNVVAPSTYTTEERRFASLWTTVGNALGPPNVEIRLVRGASFPQMVRVTHVPQGRTVVEVDTAIFGQDGKALLGDDATLPGLAHLIVHLSGGNAYMAARHGAALVKLALEDSMALREHLRA